MLPTALALVAAAPAVVPPVQETAHPRTAALAVGFVENAGQAPEAVRFHARQGPAHLWLVDEGLVLALPTPDADHEDAALRLLFRGADASAVEAVDPLPGRRHFLRAGGAVLDARAADAVRYRGLYPGVDLRVARRDGELAYDFELAPGATLSDVRLAIEGAGRLWLEDERTLAIETPAGTLTQTIPACWQVRSDGAREPLEGRFVLHPDGTLGFALEGRDPELAAVLDPVLGFATYVGGSHCEFANDVAVDELGRSYVVGITQSVDFPTTAGVLDPNWSNDEAFLAALEADGASLRFATFLGGSGDDSAASVRVDPLGARLWVGGETESADFPTTAGAFDTTKGDFEDGFVVRLNGDGTALDWGTFLGGADSDRVERLALDGTERVLVTGATASVDFPVTPGVGQSTAQGGFDAFLTVLSADGANVDASTYFGGASDDFGTGVMGFVNGELALAGTTRSDDLPTSPGALQPARAGGEDGFVARFSSDLSTLQWGTYLGGSGDDRVADAATWSSQDIYLVGVTESSDYPVTLGAVQTAPGGADDAFVTIVEQDGASLLSSSYFGGSGNDGAAGLALDPVGTTYVVGTTKSSDLTLTGDAFQTAIGGGSDAFHAIFSNDGTALNFSTYYGGPKDDNGRGIAQDDFTGVACFVGHALYEFPTTPGALSETFNGGSGDGFVVCTSPLPCPTTAAAVVLGSPCNTATLSVPPLVQGTFVTVDVSNAPPATWGVLYYSNSGAAPFPFEGLCDVWVDLANANPFLTFTTDPTGSWDVQLALPNDAPRCSKKVTFQAAIVDPVGGPLSIGQLTNGVECTFGS